MGKCGPNDLGRANGTGAYTLEAVQQFPFNVPNMKPLCQTNI